MKAVMRSLFHRTNFSILMRYVFVNASSNHTNNNTMEMILQLWKFFDNTDSHHHSKNFVLFLAPKKKVKKFHSFLLGMCLTRIFSSKI